MKNSLKDNRKLLFNWACKGLKYFLLILLGLAIALIVSHAFGAVSLVGLLLSASIWLWLLRIAVFLFSLFAIAMMIESWS